MLLTVGNKFLQLRKFVIELQVELIYMLLRLDKCNFIANCATKKKEGRSQEKWQNNTITRKVLRHPF